ncbi:MAG: GNAT family N-acetyltransferase, partial [Alphaproteobacteria bacterium]
PEDAPRIHAYTADPEVSRHLTWRPHRTMEDTHAYLAASIERRKAGKMWTYVIDAPETRGAGAIDFRPSDDGHAIMFGYVLARPLWGRGYMTEALRAAVAVALDQPGVYRAWAFCKVDNAASARVMEKAGMAYEGTLRRWAIAVNIDPDVPVDCRVYASVR